MVLNAIILSVIVFSILSPIWVENGEMINIFFAVTSKIWILEIKGIPLFESTTPKFCAKLSSFCLKWNQDRYHLTFSCLKTKNKQVGTLLIGWNLFFKVFFFLFAKKSVLRICFPLVIFIDSSLSYLSFRGS